MTRCPACRHENPEAAHFCNACGSPLPAASNAGAEPARETRKTVTVLFCDVTGSTALGERLDAESFRAVLARYFASMRGVVVRHGGTVEKFIGDAVMAVFGVPLVHEDDALRAVRSAWEMGESLADLNDELERDYGTRLNIRVGVDTGEVVTGTHERLATGDTVNLAARLQQAAEPGQILIGEQTLGLTHNAVDAVPVGPVALKGKSLPVAAFRLLGVRPATEVVGRWDAPIIGREAELESLRAALDGVIRERVCRTYTIVGSAGTGKSRLIRELLTAINGTTVIQGRCLSYGEGTAYWPLVEAITPLAPRLDALDLDPIAKATIDRLLRGGSISGDEIAWAFRKLTETISVATATLVLFDDIQWADDVFLDLIEHLPLVSRGAPILLLCAARPDLFDKRPQWIADMRLEPLDAADVERLIDQCLGGVDISPHARDRIRGSSGGNPLFVEEMTALVQVSRGADASIPATLKALLAARIDQLEPAERRLLSRAAVEGEVFHRGAVQALMPDEHNITGQLTALARKELIVSHAAQLPGEDGFRFRHLLFRDAAYDSTPKAVRAELHERFAIWLEAARGEQLAEAEAILGYHYEQAYRYRASLGPLDGHAQELGSNAAKLLASAANRTLARGQAGVAVSLLERAAALVPSDDHRRLELLPKLGHAFKRRGDLTAALSVLDDAIESGRTAGNTVVELRARIERARVMEIRDPREVVNLLLHEAEAAIPILERLGDDEGLAIAWQGIAEAHMYAMQHGRMIDALQRSLTHARRPSGNEELATEAETWLVPGWVYGPTPATEMARLADALGTDKQRTPRREVWRLILAAVAAMLLGRFSDAEDLFARSRGLVEGIEAHEEQSSAFTFYAQAALSVGDMVTAEQQSRMSYEMLSRAEAKGWSVTSAAILALALIGQGRYEEAEPFAEISRLEGSPTDILNEAQWRRARALLLAWRGDVDDAVGLARAAVAISAPTDALNERGDAHVDLADLLCLAGRESDARSPLQAALALYEQKENRVRAAVVRARLGV